MEDLDISKKITEVLLNYSNNEISFEDMTDLVLKILDDVDLLDCPCCGDKSVGDTNMDGDMFISCQNDKCRFTAPKCSTVTQAKTKWNEIARKLTSKDQINV